MDIPNGSLLDYVPHKKPLDGFVLRETKIKQNKTKGFYQPTQGQTCIVTFFFSEIKEHSCQIGIRIVNRNDLVPNRESNRIVNRKDSVTFSKLLKNIYLHI